MELHITHYHDINGHWYIVEWEGKVIGSDDTLRGALDHARITLGADYGIYVSKMETYTS